MKTTNPMKAQHTAGRVKLDDVFRVQFRGIGHDGRWLDSTQCYSSESEAVADILRYGESEWRIVRHAREVVASGQTSKEEWVRQIFKNDTKATAQAGGE